MIFAPGALKNTPLKAFWIYSLEVMVSFIHAGRQGLTLETFYKLTHNGQNVSFCLNSYLTRSVLIFFIHGGLQIKSDLHVMSTSGPGLSAF
jgi:hypothetical protein